MLLSLTDSSHKHNSTLAMGLPDVNLNSFHPQASPSSWDYIGPEQFKDFCNETLQTAASQLSQLEEAGAQQDQAITAETVFLARQEMWLGCMMGVGGLEAKISRLQGAILATKEKLAGLKRKAEESQANHTLQKKRVREFVEEGATHMCG